MADPTVAEPTTRERRLDHAPAPARSMAALLGPEIAVVLALVGLALLAHGLNMFSAPAFKEDEGTYAAQAWAVLRMGRVTPYTYTYDHAPAGWIMAAAWMLVTGGPDTFGGTVVSGRALMLVLHVAGVVLLYRLARKLGCGVPAAGTAALLFAVSPLVLTYQRLFLLDTIMVFWLLVCLNLLLDGWGRLSRVVLSGVAFGIAVLTKETAIFLLPAVIFVALQQRWSHQGRFALAAWVVPALAVISWYPLYAALKGELLPAGHALGFAMLSRGSGARTSLLEAVRWQASRQGAGAPGGMQALWGLVRGDWLPRDGLLLAGGAVATVVNLARGLRDRRALAAGLLGILPIAYLARGGVVFDFYVLFALPFLALNLGVAAHGLFRGAPAVLRAGLALVLVAGLAAGYVSSGGFEPLLRERPAAATREAIAWIKDNVPQQSRMVVGDELWADLREPGLAGPAFPNVHSHWKVAADPGVRDRIFGGDWRRVEYLVMAPALRATFRASGNKVALEALDHASLVRSWRSGAGAVELWKVDPTGATQQWLPAESARHLRARFERDGAWTDRDGVVTSEAQAYAMLRAVWSDDRAGFDRAWGWTRRMLRRPDGLLSWLWKDGAVADPNSASDADVDAAMALLLAGKQWGAPSLTQEGARLAAAIWEQEVTTAGAAPVLAPGNWATGEAVVPVNPSYLSPAAFRLFAEADPAHDWGALLDSSYRLLDEAAEDPLGRGRSAGLPPDWVGVDRETGRLRPLQKEGRDTTTHGYDAARVWWRVGLDERWSHDGRARTFLRRAQFLGEELGRKATVSAVYAHDGSVVEEAPSMVAVAGTIAALATINPPASAGLFSREVVAGATRGEGGVWWGNPDDLYTQEWGWFAAAFMSDAMARPPGGG